MALSVGGQTLEGPWGTGEPKQIFYTLCDQFKLDRKIGDFLLESEGLETLDDFIHFVTSEKAAIGYYLASMCARIIRFGRILSRRSSPRFKTFRSRTCSARVCVKRGLRPGVRNP